MIDLLGNLFIKTMGHYRLTVRHIKDNDWIVKQRECIGSIGMKSARFKLAPLAPLVIWFKSYVRWHLFDNILYYLDTSFLLQNRFEGKSVLKSC